MHRGFLVYHSCYWGAVVMRSSVVTAVVLILHILDYLLLFITLLIVY